MTCQNCGKQIEIGDLNRHVYGGEAVKCEDCGAEHKLIPRPHHEFSPVNFDVALVKTHT